VLNIWDNGHEWVPQMHAAAMMRGFPAQRVGHDSLLKPGTMFFIPNQFPAERLVRDVRTALALRDVTDDLVWIQDRDQLLMYEDKLAQAAEFWYWMPYTKVSYSLDAAIAAVDTFGGPIVSKSAYGSASHNVRLLHTRGDAIREAELAFGLGIPTRRGPGPDVFQRDYVLWQNFIPHEFTYRVTIVGTKFHVYKRFNYDDRPMACPSKVKQTEPVAMSETIESLLDFSARFFKAIGTKWCAIDVLAEPTGALHRWRVLETSLAWARGNDPSGNACFYGTQRSLNTQFDLLIDELERAPW